MTKEREGKRKRNVRNSVKKKTIIILKKKKKIEKLNRIVRREIWKKKKLKAKERGENWERRV